MPAFAITIFVGAFLLFQVQPMMGKFILPWFGGSPAVWTTCMLFFQIVLLGGYAYAHWLTTWVKPRKQAALHCLFLLASVSVLPIIPGEMWKPDPAANPTWHILLLLGATIGLPYFVLSSTGPLMQKWFSWLHPGQSPYRLYALSNIGSLLALVSYPFWIEPLLSRKQQAAIWTLGLFAFVAVCSFCVWNIWVWGEKRNERIREYADDETEPMPKTPVRYWLLWLLLPACASALLLSTTNKICVDVAVIPFLWVLPLTIYLLTFILCFDTRKWYWRRAFLPLFVAMTAGVVWVMDNIDEVPMTGQIAAFSGLLFAACMICHGELYRLRPHPRRLTHYYLLISLGGALGGLFVALGAPNLFLTHAEFHWTVAATGLLAWIACFPNFKAETFKLWHLKLWICGILTVLALSIGLYQNGHEEGDNVVAEGRNFYGSLQVLEYWGGDELVGDEEKPYLLLQHGRITHGLQLTEGDDQDLPTTYYSENSGVGLAMYYTRETVGRKIGLIGLGAGTLAAHGQPTDTLRFYEINPMVKQFAEEHFTYLARCPSKVDIVMGDARLNMEREEPQNYSVIAVDAFSSDAIPVHLITAEAFLVYEKHLAEGGYLAIHISNRFLNLEPVVANAAREFGYHHATVTDSNPLNEWWTYESTWMVLSKSEQAIERLRKGMIEEEEEPSGIQVPLWTDDYSSLFKILDHTP